MFDLKLSQTRTLQNAVMVALELFKTGRVNYLEVIIAQQNSLNAKLDLIEIENEIAVTKVQLYKALGGGWK